MGKKEKAPAEAGAEKPKKKAPPQPEKPKYGVPELAAALGVKPSSARVQLRKAAIKKTGKLYGWETKEEMQKVIDKLKSTKKAPKKAKKAAAAATEEDDEDEEETEEDEGDED